MGNSEIAIKKRELRRSLRARRSGMSELEREKADAAITRNVMSLPLFEEADLVLPYLDMGSEVCTRHIIEAAWAAGKSVALPGCVPNTRHMRWFLVSSLEGLVRSPLGVEEPVPNPELEVFPGSLGEDRRMLAIVPGLSFDPNGFRLGYGGGFYDTFLGPFRGASVGLCRDALFSDDLVGMGVIDKHDLSVDAVVTESRIIVCRQRG